MNDHFVYDWIERWAQYSPHKVIFKDYQSQKSWTYSEFNKRTNAVALFLLNDLKLKKGDRIAIYSFNRPEHVFLFFACVKSGIIFVPLNFRLAPSEIDVLLYDSQPSVLIYEEAFQEKINKLKFTSEAVKLVGTNLFCDFLHGKIADKEFKETTPIFEKDIVMILYTSGTTGIPKGVMINHRMLFWNSINTEIRLNITSEDHTQNYAPFFHTGAWNVLLTPFVHHGASITLLPYFDPDLILKLFQEEKTTIFFGVPTMLQMIAESSLFEQTDFSSVRYAVVGGAPMPVSLINKWHDKGVFIRQGYGLTEVGPNCFSLHQDDAKRKIGSIGFPNFYISAKITDENGKECQANAVGELCLKSPVVTPGYWNKPEETEKTIIDGWFHTGDMVRRDSEGYFYVVDRKKNMYISGGENVYPAEIETVLRMHPGIKDSAVIGVPDEKWGEVGKAFIILNDAQTTEKDIIQFCIEKLAKYKIPKYVQFVTELPRNEAGKLDRKRLQEIN